MTMGAIVFFQLSVAIYPTI